MKFKTLKSDITNPTILYVADWISLIQAEFREDQIFDNVDDLAEQLEKWRHEFMDDQSSLDQHWGDQVTVATYGHEVILISDQRSGEFVKLYDFDFTVTPKAKPRKLLIFLFLLSFFMVLTSFPAKAEGLFGPKNGREYAAKMNRKVVKKGKKTIKSFRGLNRKGQK
jgi:hypothetical protein